MDRAIIMCILAVLFIQFKVSEQKPTRFSPSSSLESKPDHERESKEPSTSNLARESISLESKNTKTESVELSQESFGLRNKPRLSIKPFVRTKGGGHGDSKTKEQETDMRTTIERHQERRREQGEENKEDIKEVMEMSQVRYPAIIKQKESIGDESLLGVDNTTLRVIKDNLKILYLKNNLQRLKSNQQLHKTAEESNIRFQAKGDYKKELNSWKPANYELRSPNPSVSFTSVKQVIQNKTRSTPEIQQISPMTNTEIDAPSRTFNIGSLNEQENRGLLVKPGLVKDQRNDSLQAKPEATQKPRLQLIQNKATQTPTAFPPQTRKKIEEIKDDITAIANEEDYTDIGREHIDHDESIERLEQQIDDMMMMERRFEDLEESEDIVDDMGIEKRDSTNENKNLEIENEDSKTEDKGRKRLTKHVLSKRAITDVFEDSVGLINSLPLIDIESMVPGQTEETPTSTQRPEETISNVDRAQNNNEKGEEFRTVITFEEKSGTINDGTNLDEVTQKTVTVQDTTMPIILGNSTESWIKTNTDYPGSQMSISTTKINTEEIALTTVRTTDKKSRGELTELKESVEITEEPIKPLFLQLNNTDIDPEHLRELRTDKSNIENSETHIENTNLFPIEKESATEISSSQNIEESTTIKDTPTNIEVTTAADSRSEKDDDSQTTTVRPTTLQQAITETITIGEEISTRTSVSIKVSVSMREKIEKVDGKKTDDNAVRKIVNDVDMTNKSFIQETTTIKHQSDKTMDIISKNIESIEGSTKNTTELNEATVPTLGYDNISSTEAIVTRQNTNDDDGDTKTEATNEIAIKKIHIKNETGLELEDGSSSNGSRENQVNARERTDKPIKTSESQPELNARKEDPDSITSDVQTETLNLFKMDLSTQRSHENVEITTFGVLTNKDTLEETEVATTDSVMMNDSLSNGNTAEPLTKSLNGTSENIEYTDNRNETMVEGKQDKLSEHVRNEMNDSGNESTTKESPLVLETLYTTSINNLQETKIGNVSTTEDTKIIEILEEKDSNLNVALSTTEAMIDDSLKIENTVGESFDDANKGEISSFKSETIKIENKTNETTNKEENLKEHNITTDHTPNQEKGKLKNEKQGTEISSSSIKDISENIMNHNESNVNTSGQMSDKSSNNEMSINNTNSQADTGLEQKPINSSEIFKNNIPINMGEIKESQRNKNINRFKLRPRPTYQRPKFRKNQEPQVSKQDDNMSGNGTDETHAHKDMINTRRIIVDKMNSDIVQTIATDKHRFSVRTKNKINQQKHEQSELLKEKFSIKPVLGLKNKLKSKTNEEIGEITEETVKKMTEENNTNTNNSKNNSNLDDDNENEENLETVQENSETSTDSNESETDENNQDNSMSIKERLTKQRQEKIKNRYLTTVQKHRQHERIQISKSNEIKNRINAMIDRQNADELGSSRSKFTNLQRLGESNGGRIKYTPIRTVKTNIKIPIDKLWTEENNFDYESNPEVTNSNGRNSNSFRPTTTRTLSRKSTTQSLYTSLMAEKKPQTRPPFRPSSRRTTEKTAQYELEESQNRRVDEDIAENEPEENPTAPVSGAFDRPVSISKYQTKPFNRNVQNIPLEKELNIEPSNSRRIAGKLTHLELKNSENEQDQSENEEQENSNPSAPIVKGFDRPISSTVKYQRNPSNRNIQNIPFEREQIKSNNQIKLQRLTIAPLRISPNRFSNFKKISSFEKLEKVQKPKMEIEEEKKRTEVLEDLNEQELEPTSSPVETLDYDIATPNYVMDSKSPDLQHPSQNELNELSKSKNDDRSTSHLKRLNSQRNNILGRNLNPRLLKLLSHETKSR
ncbi:hypothetical protein WDU94_006161 [Cyamophila willieti]